MSVNDTPKHERREVGTIRLRGIEPTDLELLKQWRNEQKKYYREYRMINQPHQEKWYESTIGATRHAYYAIDVWDGQWWLVGACGWTNINWVHRHAELSIYIGENDWRGRGVGLKTMLQLHHIAFNEFNMLTVRLEVFAINPAVEFYKKFGYKMVGEYRMAYFYDGEYCNSILMDMTREEWHDRYSTARMDVPIGNGLHPGDGAKGDTTPYQDSMGCVGCWSEQSHTTKYKAPETPAP